MKKVLKAIWDEFIYGGHLLSLGACGIIYSASVLLKTDITWSIIIISYLLSQTLYLFNRYKEFEIDSETNPERTIHFKKYIKRIPALIIIGMIVVFLIMLSEKRYNAMFFSLAPISVGLLYSICLKNMTSKITGLKTFIVSLVWTAYVPFLIIFYHNHINLLPFCLVSFFVFIRWIINTSFFDIKDIDQDKKANLNTLPIYFGKQKYLIILHVLNFISVIPLAAGIALGFFPLATLIFCLLIPYTFYYLTQGSQKKINMNVYYIVADGEFLIWGFIAYIIKNI